MKYTIYKITNKLNGKSYIGKHKTKDLNDGYMGSGKYLNYAIEKHGLENFKKQILFVYDNAKECSDKEAELVNEEYLSEGNTYNLKLGGTGGFDWINSHLTKEFTIQRAKKGYSAVANLSALGNANKPRFIKKIHCEYCNIEFMQKDKVQRFCSQSHAAKFNNSKRKSLCSIALMCGDAL